MPKAPDDAWEYWNAMQALRAEGAQLAVPAGTALRKCPTKISGADVFYYDLCAIPWLGVTSNTAPPYAAKAVFPIAYFQWVQRYLRAALQHQPAATASGLARVFWAVDVWAHMQYAFFALNIPYGEAIYRFQRARRTYAPTTPISGRIPALDPFHAHLDDYRSALSFLTPKPSAWRFGPFQESVIDWCGMPPNSKQPSTVWQLLLQAMVPWTTDWASKWLQSKNGKDSAELAGADEVYAYALMQWRLVSVQDWDNYSHSSSQSADWPLGMGSRYNCATLTDFAKYISYNEKPQPEITVSRAGVAEPNFAWVYGKDLPAQITGFLTVNYENVLRTWFSYWLDLEGPHFSSDGSLDAGQIQPVTQDDYGDIDKGMSAAAVARAQAANENPRLSCAKGDNACLQAANAALKLKAFTAKSPLAGLQNQIAAGFAFVLNKFGVDFATSGAIPFFVLGPPFARTYEAVGYSTAPDGSSIDVLPKIFGALVNLKSLTGVDVLAAPSAFAARSAPAKGHEGCHFNVEGVEICPSSPAMTTSAAVAAQMDYPTECKRQFGVWVQQNAGKIRIPADAEAMYIAMCLEIAAGKLAPAEFNVRWNWYIHAAQSSLWRSFVRGFIGAGNPLEG